MEVEVVCKYDMVEAFLVAGELFLVLFASVKVSVVNIFGFYVKYRRVGFLRRNDEIGAPQSVLAGSLITTKSGSISLSSC